jgi:hypothetical protein
LKSHEVIRQAVDEPGVKAVAAALKVSPALLYKWCEPASADDPDQSGTRNPLDRVNHLYHITRDIRLIRWLCNQAGGFYVADPDLDIRPSIDQAIFNETRGMVRDFSQLLETVTASVEDDAQIDLGEADRIRQKWEDLKACVERFVISCERGHYRPPENRKT